MNKIISLLVSCAFLVPASNATEKKLHNTGDLSNTNSNISLQYDCIEHPSNATEKLHNTGDLSNTNSSINLQYDCIEHHKHKPKYKYSHKWKKHNYNNKTKCFNVNSNVNKNVTKFQEILNNDIHSKKFKMLGDIHKKIMNNDTALIKKLNINDNTLKQYKCYYDQLMNKTLENNYINISDDANNLMTHIYISINDDVINAYSNMNYAKRIIWNRNINSDKKLHGDNILKVIADLSNAIADWSKCASQTTLDFSKWDNTKKIKIYNTAAQQLQYIQEIFGIK